MVSTMYYQIKNVSVIIVWNFINKFLNYIFIYVYVYLYVCVNIVYMCMYSNIEMHMEKIC